MLSDKYKVREFVSKNIGEQYLIELLACENEISDLKFETLPEQFVIKTNFGSGSEHIEIVKNKSLINKLNIERKFNLAMKSQYKGSILGETQYDFIDKRIIVEKFIDNNGKDIDDFKFHIFNSKNGFLQIDFDRFTNHKRNLYDLNFKQLDFELCHSGGKYNLPSIDKLQKMKEIALKLSQGFDYVRIDLYLVNEQILFGEMTFTPGSGLEKFSTLKADKLYGQMWEQK